MSAWVAFELNGNNRDIETRIADKAFFIFVLDMILLSSYISIYLQKKLLNTNFLCFWIISISACNSGRRKCI